MPQHAYRNSGDSVFLHRSAALFGIKIHGRRVNDEVELFEWEGGKVSSA